MRTAALAALLLAGACSPRREPPREERSEAVEGLTLSQSQDGKPAWTLRSRLAILREEDHAADLDAPVMEFYRDGKAVSRVTARKGAVDTATRDVKLSSSVELDSFDDRSRLTTDELLYTAKTGRFHTDAPVVVTRPGGVMRGQGLDASPDLTEIRVYHQRSVLTGPAR